MRIFLVRHGFSEGNENKEKYAVVGDPNIKLTETGWHQAIAAGGFLKSYLEKNPGKSAPLIWSSSYRRTRETAAGLLHGADGAVDEASFRVDSRLIEMMFGELRNLKNPEEREAHLPLHMEFFAKAKEHDIYYARPLSGESPMDVQLRVASFFEDVFKEAKKNGGRDVVVVSHGVTLIAMMMELAKIDPVNYKKIKLPDNCDVYMLEGERNHFTLSRIWKGAEMREVDQDLTAMVKGTYLPEVPAHLKKHKGPKPV